MERHHKDFNVVAPQENEFPPELFLDIFRKMFFVRCFENWIPSAVNNKLVTYPVYLSSGQESAASALSCLVRSYQIFAQHRAHDIFLTFGAPPELLMDELLGLPTGSSGGRAGSNCLQYHDDKLNMYGHHGLIGENVPQGVGAALANHKNTLCVFGDGSAEEDYVLASLGFAATHKLPVLFVCVDNNLSILTPTSVRRSWVLEDVARSFGLDAADCADDPFSIIHYVQNMKLPALINIRVCRQYWHVGVGNDGATIWNRFDIFRKYIMERGFENELIEIENKVEMDMKSLWEKRLSLKQSVK